MMGTPSFPNPNSVNVEQAEPPGLADRAKSTGNGVDSALHKAVFVTLDFKVAIRHAATSAGVTDWFSTLYS